MRILHLTGSITANSAGLGTAVIGLSQAQEAHGASPVIWTLDSTESLNQVAEREAIQTVAMLGFPSTGPRQIGLSLQMERMAATAATQFDVLHQHSIWLALSRASTRWRTTFARPTVVSPHGTLEEYTLQISRWKKKLALLAYEMDNLRSASCLHATSLQEASSIRNFGLKNPIAVIPNGVPESWLTNSGDAARFRAKYSIATDRRIVFFLSRLHPKKGIPLLLEAFAQTKRRQEWVLAIAGFEDYEGYAEKLKQVTEQLGISDSTMFLGGLFGDDRQDAFSAADLFVLPSYSENFAIVVIEALAAGVPVLTTFGTPWRELVDNNCGWWVEASIEAIKSGLSDAFQRPPTELLEMGQRGKKLVERQYIWRRIAEQTLVLYEWLLGHRPQPIFVLTDN